jgi:uncharacterized protein YidB (DUF937 family)
MIEFLKKLLAMLFSGKTDNLVLDLIKSQIIGTGTTDGTQTGSVGTGLQDLITQLGKKGLSDAVASWVSTGPNEPITGEQVSEALGSEKLSELANKSGLSIDVLKDKLAQFLPKVVDQMTPGGKIPE